MPRPRPAADRPREPVRAARAGLAGLLAAALVAAPAGASEPARPPANDLSESAGPDADRDAAAEDVDANDGGVRAVDAEDRPASAADGEADVDAAAGLAIAAQRRFELGDVGGAIDLWQRALAAVPVTQASAHRRAGLTLAIAAAHVQLAVGAAAQSHLQAALDVLDAHLAALDPTDDENRVAVEQRRGEVAARLAALRRLGRAPARDPAPLPADRRLQIGGGALLGLGVGGLALLAAGLGLGERADRELAAAVERPGDDPEREGAVADARTRGLRSNQLAVAGGVLGGALLVVGVALLIAGRAGRPARGRRLALAASGVAWRF